MNKNNQFYTVIEDINKTNYYIDYEHYYKCRPNLDDLKIVDNGHDKCIEIRTIFPKTIKKGMYIRSALGPVAYDAVKEYEALYLLHKPLYPCAVTGHWEGMPFLLIAEEDIEITLEDEKFIQDYLHNHVNWEEFYQKRKNKNE